MLWRSHSSMLRLVGVCGLPHLDCLLIVVELLESNAIAWPNPSMWCSVLNPVIPVPTYHQDDGPSSHAHSPGRKSLLLRNIKNQTLPGPAMAHTTFQNRASASLFGAQGLQMPFLGDNIGSIDTPSFTDPFTDSAYLEWASSLVNTDPTDVWDGTSIWPTNPRTQRQSNSDTIMADYIPPNKPDPMHVSGPSLEDEPMSLKVPTNTPSGGSTDEGQHTHSVSQQAVLPSDFASTLTRSLLNQPFPLPTHHNATVSSKDNHQLLGQGSSIFMQSTTRADTTGFRKTMFGADSVDSAVPISLSTKSSCGDIGSMIASLGCGQDGSLATPSSSGHTESCSVSSGGKSSGNANTVTKRTRNFTPASVRAIDEEDEPRRVSPHARTAGYDVVDILSDVTVGN